MKKYELRYNKEAPFDGEENTMFSHFTIDKNDGWEKWSLPLGNGYLGANVFGRTETERIQITENSLCNPFNWDKRYPGGNGGLQSFCDLFIDFCHKDAEDYRRGLDLETATAYTEYVCGGVKYEREHFASYPDKVLVTGLKADKIGALSFKVRAEVPFCKPYLFSEGDGMGRTGEVRTEENRIIISGKMEYYGIEYEGQITVSAYGGEILTHPDCIEV